MRLLQKKKKENFVHSLSSRGKSSIDVVVVSSFVVVVVVVDDDDGVCNVFINIVGKQLVN